MTELTTDRLLLRAWAEDDLDEYARIVADPAVMRFLGGPIDRSAAWRQIALFAGHRALRGWTQSAVVERASGRLVGRGGLWQPEGWPGLEVGWTLARHAWGRGFASELGRAVRDAARALTGADELISVIHRDNSASIRVAVAIGAVYRCDLEIHGEPCVIFGQSLPGGDGGLRREARAHVTCS